MLSYVLRMVFIKWLLIITKLNFSVHRELKCILNTIFITDDAIVFAGRKVISFVICLSFPAAIFVLVLPSERLQHINMH